MIKTILISKLLSIRSSKLRIFLVVLVLISILLVPLLFLRTESIFSSELVEVRVGVDEVQQVNSQQIRFSLSLTLISKLNIRVGIPLDEEIISIGASPNLNQLIMDYSFSYNFLQPHSTFKISNPLSPYFNQKVVLIPLKADSGFSSHLLMTVTLTIIFSGLSKLLKTDSLQFRPYNLLSTSLLGRIIFHRANFLYTSATYGWSNDQTNAPIPYLSSGLTFSTAVLYFRVMLVLIGYTVIYFFVFLRKPSKPKNDNVDLLFPEER